MRHRLLTFAALILTGSYVNFAPRELSQVKGTAAAVEGGPQVSVKALNGSKFNGLLLGTHWSSGDGNFGEVKPGDRTWWIAEIGGQIQIREIPNILFPRKERFWTAGTREIQDDKSFERYVWTAPLGKPSESAKPDLSNPPCSSQANARDILFIGTDYIAIREFGSGICAHYDEGTVYYVSTPENPNWLDTSDNFGLKISGVLGPLGLEHFNKALSAMGAAKSEDLDCGRLSVRPENWAIRRDKGHWVVRGNGSYGGHVCDGYFGTEFDIKIRLPKSVVGYDELVIGWGKIQETFADAKDAFESPDGNFLAVLRAGDLAVYRLANGKIGDVVSQRALHENEYAVMAQWSLGENVARWDQQVSRLLNSPAK
jgi:hypothetical protein